MGAHDFLPARFAWTRGFTLVEIMIVVAIIGLVAAVAIPNLLRSRVNSNDKAALGDLRAFNAASQSFYAAQTPGRYPLNLGELTATGGGAAYLDSAWTQNSARHGHTLTYSAGTNGSGFTLTATAIPNEGAVSYCLDHSGTIYQSAATGCGGTPGVASCSGQGLSS